MISNAKSCANWQLYCIIDRAASGGRDVAELTQSAVRGGADVIQLRDKISSSVELIEDAKRCLAIARAASVPFIINDRVDVAKATASDGVHLGQDDVSVAFAREVLGEMSLIGVSTHNKEQATKALNDGADYIGCGPLYTTPTKPNYKEVGLELINLARVCFRGTVVCIGGIQLNNIEQVVNAGGSCVAVVRAICAADDPEAAARALKRALQKFDYTKQSGL